MLKFDGAFLLGAALLTPVSVKTLRADDEHRYYDKEHKDYHAWNEGEEHAWRRYWEEQHRPYVSWEKARRKSVRNIGIGVTHTPTTMNTATSVTRVRSL